MKIFCPVCAREIRAEDIDLAGSLAKCVSCNNVFSCEAQLPAVSSEGLKKSSVEKPKNFTLEWPGNGLVIVRKWFSWLTTVPLAIFCLVWNGFMVMWFSIAFLQKQYMMAVFGTLHGAVGVGLIYAVLANILNKTSIRISYDSLVVTIGPLPSFGQKNIARRDVRQLFVREVVHPSKNGTSLSYSVEVITVVGKTICLVSGLPKREEAQFVEQEVEKYLGITDERVRGEALP